MTCIKPAGHRVLVKPLPLDNKTKSGILLAHDERKEKAQIRGTVVAIGPNAWKAFDEGEPWAAVGDEVWFAQYGGYLVRDPVTEDEYRLLNDEDVCAVRQRDCEACASITSIQITTETALCDRHREALRGVQ